MKRVAPESITLDAGLVSTSVPEPEDAWAVDATYAIDDLAYRPVAGIHQLFKSAANANAGHDPATDDGTWWTKLGPTNRWGMFDGKVQTQTTAVDEISVELQPAAWAETLALLNISGTAVRIEITDETEGLVHDQTFSLTSTSGIVDFYGYCYAPIIRKTDLILVDLPIRLSPVIKVTLSAPGETVGVGALILGFARQLGKTRWGGGAGFDDFSVKGRDAFGNLVPVERDYSKRGNFTVLIEPGMVDEFQRVLAQYRAQAGLYIGDERYGIMAIYGFVKSFDEVVEYETHIEATMEIEGLT